jgi:nicotinamide mononucleotide transporter
VTWIVAAASLFATWLNVRRHPACFMIWMITNSIWAGTCMFHGLHAQSCLHFIYALMAVWGLQRWTDPSPAAAASDTARAAESPP